MAIEALITLALATLILGLFSIYADKHRTPPKSDQNTKTDSDDTQH